MRMSKTRLAILASLTVCLIPFVNPFAQGFEKPVKMNDLPAAVRKTVEQQSEGAIVRGLSKEIENGEAYYEVELRVQGHNKDVLIDSEGTVVEIEEEADLASLPATVRAQLEKQAGLGKIVMVESVTRKGALVAYEAHVTRGRKRSEIKVSPEGQLIKD